LKVCANEREVGSASCGVILGFQYACLFSLCGLLLFFLKQMGESFPTKYISKQKQHSIAGVWAFRRIIL
jgi:hypothetical protein